VRLINNLPLIKGKGIKGIGFIDSLIRTAVY